MNMEKLSARTWSAEDLLDALGLERRWTFARSTATATGLFGAGMLIGAGLALLLSPRNGGEARGQVGHVDSEGSRPLTQM